MVVRNGFAFIKGAFEKWMRKIDATDSAEEDLRRENERPSNDEIHFKCKPLPFVIFLISAIQISAFIYYSHDGCNNSLPMESPLIYNPRRRKEVWRYVTYVLIHKGCVHLAVNICIQLVVGVPLEMAHGYLRVFMVYFVSIVAGCMVFSLADPKFHLAGASAGVAGLGAALLVTFALKSQMSKESKYSKLLYKALFTLGVMAMLIFINYNLFDNPKNPSSDASHIAGCVPGLLMGITILPDQKNQIIKWARIISGVISIAAFIVMIGCSVAYLS